MRVIPAKNETAKVAWWIVLANFSIYGFLAISMAIIIFALGNLGFDIGENLFTAVLRLPYQTILPGMLVVNLALIFRNTRTNVPRMRAHIISLFVLPVASVLFGMVIFGMIGLLVMLVITMMA